MCQGSPPVVASLPIQFGPRLYACSLSAQRVAATKLRRPEVKLVTCTQLPEAGRKQGRAIARLEYRRMHREGCTHQIHLLGAVVAAPSVFYNPINHHARGE